MHRTAPLLEFEVAATHITATAALDIMYIKYRGS